MIHVDIINASTVLTDAAIEAVIPALHKQVTNHFYPIWGINAKLHFVQTGHTPKSGHWWIAILDNSDVADALGYHDLTADGLPLGKVFAGTDMQYGLSWTITLSHELLEMLVDPYINLTAQIDRHRLYAYEVCDACEEDSLGYQIDGVQVSDFVTPQWFENMPHPAQTRFDYRRHITMPLELLPGGYISVLEFARGTWVQLTAQQVNAAKADFQPGSRRARRQHDCATWRCSCLA